MRTTLEKRITHLEAATDQPSGFGPSLIILTALGRGRDDVRGIQLAHGQPLKRLDGESLDELCVRAESLAAASGTPLVTLATAIYADEEESEACQ